MQVNFDGAIVGFDKRFFISSHAEKYVDEGISSQISGIEALMDVETQTAMETIRSLLDQIHVSMPIIVYAQTLVRLRLVVFH